MGVSQIHQDWWVVSFQVISQIHQNWWVVSFGLKGYSIHNMYVLCVFIGGGDTVSSENPALPQEGVKRPAADGDSNPSPKKPRMDQ